MKDNVRDILWILIFLSWQVAIVWGGTATDENYTHSVKTREQLFQTFIDIWNIAKFNFF